MKILVFIDILVDEFHGYIEKYIDGNFEKRKIKMRDES